MAAADISLLCSSASSIPLACRPAHPPFLSPAGLLIHHWHCQEGHIEAESYEKDLQYLKEKIDAGADFIVTQLFYRVDNFFKFVDDCRALGITCPIVPGIMPIQSYGGFKRMTGFCKTDVPQEISDALEAVKDDEGAVKTYGIAQSIEMCEAMRARGTKGFHIYTLNLEISATAIIKGLGLYSEEKAVRRLPWRPATSSSARSTDETVRPIFWANRPRSFLARTMDWNDFQNGRWGNNQSQVFGDLNDHYLARLDRTSRDKDGCIKLWGSPTSIADINRIFSRFATGEIDRLPWSEKPGGLEAESSLLSQRLHDLNEKGVLTVNSQPTVNGVASTDPAVGWGGPGGVVYQKGYIEFFASAETTAKIVAACRAIPSLTFQATNTSGDCQTNIQPDHPVNAVTWVRKPSRSRPRCAATRCGSCVGRDNSIFSSR